MIFHFSKDFELRDCSRERIELTRGDSLYVTARVHGGRPIGSACFALYKPLQFGGVPLANVTEFAPVVGDKYTDYMGILRLNTDALTELIGAGDEVCVAGEWEIKYADDEGNIITVTSGRVEVVVSNDYIRQSPPVQVDPEVVYATEDFVEAVLKDRVKVETEAALGGIIEDVEDAANVAREARAGAENARAGAVLAEGNALAYATSANVSKLAAEDSAREAGVYCDGAEDYYYLTKEKAAVAVVKAGDAASSAADALAAKNATEAIAGSLENVSAETKEAAAKAKVSETNAAESAKTATEKAQEAKTAVAGIGNSVTTAQTAATNAQTSATSAGASASTASSKAAAASASATQAGASATSAALSESAARENAEGAAVSAELAAESAAEAGLSAEDVRRIAAEVLAMIKEIVPPRLNYDGNHFYFNKFTEPEYPDDRCVYPYAYLKKMVGGRDNYQLWLDAGNTGTLEDFMESMKGPAGDQQELLEIKEQLESKSEALVISAADYENMADKNPRTLYIIN